MIKKTTILLGLIATSICSLAQNEGGDELMKIELNEAQKKAKQINEEFSNLPKEDRTEYLKLRIKAQQLFSQKRIFEALIEIHDLRMIFKKDPSILNLLGAISVEFRDFKHARSIFRQAIELSGEDPKLLFNIAELAFCDNEWETCLAEMDYLLKRLEEADAQSKEEAIAKGLKPPKNSYINTDFVRVMLFKQMLCHLALAQDESKSEADRSAHEQEAIKISNKFDYMIDSPFYYYAQAAIAYYRKEATEAGIWIMTAKKVFANNIEVTDSWDDTLVEFGYIESHYGKHYTEKPLSGDE